MELPRKPSEMFDRDDEWNDLARFAVDDAPGATLGVVSGRRRQGKTMLLYSLAQATEADVLVLGRMMAMAGRLAAQEGATDGFRTIVNTGRVGRQDVYHLHIHIIGGPDPLPRMIAGK